MSGQGFLSEHKARGANRSTKVAGKLKVLPEQPDPPLGRNPSKERDESAGTTGDSEEGDIDENDDEVEDVEVCILSFCHPRNTHYINRSITKYL